jgi:hypothetical protein
LRRGRNLGKWRQRARRRPAITVPEAAERRDQSSGRIPPACIHFCWAATESHPSTFLLPTAIPGSFYGFNFEKAVYNWGGEKGIPFVELLEKVVEYYPRIIVD